MGRDGRRKGASSPALLPLVQDFSLLHLFTAQGVGERGLQQQQALGSAAAQTPPNYSGMECAFKFQQTPTLNFLSVPVPRLAFDPVISSCLQGALSLLWVDMLS